MDASDPRPAASKKSRIFRSVFPDIGHRISLPSSFNAPSTPNLSFIQPDQSFVREQEELQQRQESKRLEQEEEKRNQAWQQATSFLTLRRRPMTFEDCDRSDDDLYQCWVRDARGTGVSEAIALLLSKPDKNECDLVEWYTNEVRLHFLGYVRPLVVDLLKATFNENAKITGANAENTLEMILRLLVTAEKIYLIPLVRTFPSHQNSDAIAAVRRNFHAIVSFSLPQESVWHVLSVFMKCKSAIVLGFRPRFKYVGQWLYHYFQRACDGEPVPLDKREYGEDDEQAIEMARLSLLRIMKLCREVGLGGTNINVTFAKIMNDLMAEFVKCSYSEKWTVPSVVTKHLNWWIDNKFAPLAHNVLDCFQPDDEDGNNSNGAARVSTVSEADVERWKLLALNRVGRLRVSELFDIIIEWDLSRGAIDDLKQYLAAQSNPQPARLHLTTTFSTEVCKRLLQPGASTIEVLKVYIAIICVFNYLDPDGVLLDRIARPIRRFLRERDDTVRVIILSLLADSNDPSVQINRSNPQQEDRVLIELQVELDYLHKFGLDDYSAVQDWDNMKWQPDPIDAAPDYSKFKNTDIIGSLISLFESKDVFVKEFQANLGENLLSHYSDRTAATLEREIRVLELMKARFGETTLQACEVMLKDVIDSRRIDGLIVEDLSKKQDPEQHAEEEPEFHARILSRFFWPPLHASTFRPPPAIEALANRYEESFESLKVSRKLAWIPALGHVRVKLDLQDREVYETCTPAQASIIYAFQTNDTDMQVEPMLSQPGQDDADDAPVLGKRLSTSQLGSMLEMDSDLMHSGLAFWVSRRVLRETSPGEFAVLEVLDRESAAAAAAVAGDPSSTASASASAAIEGVSGELAFPFPDGGSGDYDSAHHVLQSDDEIKSRNMEMYWQFVVGMLTNQGAMPLDRIVLMIRTLVPGAEGVQEDDMRSFLAEKVKDELVELREGGVYRMKK